jgi:Transposase IS66 family
MDTTEFTQRAQQLRLDADSVADPRVREVVVMALNLVEAVATENRRLLEENQKLKEIVRQLKGDPPTSSGSRAPTSASKPRNVSSEKERRQRDRGSKPPRTDQRSFRDIHVHEEIPCPVEPARRPADAVFFGYEDVVVQDLRIEPHNIRYRLEVWHSPSEGVIRGRLPPGVKGEFGSDLKALLVALKYVAGSSLPRIHELAEHFGVVISPASVSNILLDTAELFHGEKADILQAGLASTTYQQIDDTSARVAGQFWHTHVLCNPYYVSYFTTPNKDRMTVLDLLQSAPRTYRFNALTQQLLRDLRVPKKWRRLAAAAPQDRDLTRAELDDLLERWQSTRSGYKAPACLARLVEAAAIASYRTRPDHVRILVSDDAKQFRQLTDELALCWIHEGRHYKSLSPLVPWHQHQLDGFITQYWDFYAKLQAYRQTSSKKRAAELSSEFDDLFKTRTGYEGLDQRIATTRRKKKSLLTVLRHPEVPLHNNESELGERVAARRRDVSLHSVTSRGVRAMDTFTTIVQTAKKLAVSGYAYLRDRISGQYLLPSLATLIRQRGPPDPKPTHPTHSPIDISIRHSAIPCGASV